MDAWGTAARDAEGATASSRRAMVAGGLVGRSGMVGSSILKKRDAAGQVRPGRIPSVPGAFRGSALDQAAFQRRMASAAATLSIALPSTDLTRSVGSR